MCEKLIMDETQMFRFFSVSVVFGQKKLCNISNVVSLLWSQRMHQSMGKTFAPATAELLTTDLESPLYRSQLFSCQL